MSFSSAADYRISRPSLLSSPGSRAGWTLLIALRVVISAIFVCDVAGGGETFGRIGFGAWLLSYALAFTIWSDSLIYLFRQALAGRVVSLALTLFFIGIYFSACFDPLSAHFETLQQVDCTLTQIRERSDFGYYSTCFIGYPSRQYYLSSLPSLLLGPSSAHMNMGGFLFFLLGSVVFAAGMVRYLGGDLRADLVTGLVLTFPPHWLWLNHSLVTFEQAGYPYCLGLFLVGAIVRWQCTRSIVDAHIVILALYYCVYSYTPTIAIYLGALPVVAYLARSKPRFREVYLLLAMNVASFLLSLHYRSLELYDGTQIIAQEVKLQTAKRLVRQLIFQDIVMRNWSPEFHYVFVVFLALCLLGALGKREMLFGSWVVGAIVACVFSKGYVTWGFDEQFLSLRGLFRVSVVLPIFSLMFARQLARLSNAIPYSHLALIPWIALSLGYGMEFRKETREGRRVEKNYILAERINRRLIERSAIRVYGDPALPRGLDWPHVWSYYLPGFERYEHLESCSSLVVPEGKTAIFLFERGSACFEEAKQTGGLTGLRKLTQGEIGHNKTAQTVDVLCGGCGSSGRETAQQHN